MAKEDKKIIAGLDIGTSKIVAIIAEVKPDGRHEIIGIGQSESKGLKKGVVVNLDQTVNSIEAALSEAETMAGMKTDVVCTGIAGGHIRSFNSPGMVTLKNKEITQWDLDRVLDMAKSVNLPEGQQFIHAVTQEYVVDGQEGVHDPIGMSGMRLEVRAHIVTGAVSAVDNIVKCIRRCQLDVSDLMLQPIASADAVLSQDEKNMGAVVIDIGASPGTCRGAPGTGRHGLVGTPRTAIRFSSGSTFTMSRFWMVTVSTPIWPAPILPLKIREGSVVEPMEPA